jgi:DNA-directed RNA polymerase sigma subunit (sigma70/sigma32)
MKKAQEELFRENIPETPANIAEKIRELYPKDGDVTEEKIQQYLIDRQSLLSIDEKYGSSDSDSTWVDHIGEDSDFLEEIAQEERYDIFRKALDKLKNRELDIVKLNRGFGRVERPYSLEEISEMFSVPVSEIENIIETVRSKLSRTKNWAEVKTFLEMDEKKLMAQFNVIENINIFESGLEKTNQLGIALRYAIEEACLTSREMHIFKLFKGFGRYFKENYKGISFQKIGEIYNLSRQRISQIYVEARNSIKQTKEYAILKEIFEDDEEEEE